MVLSVELVEITILSGQQQGSASMTKGQVAGNCVPFIEINAEDEAFAFHGVNPSVWFSGSTVYAERGYSTSFGVFAKDVSIYVYVVEFSPSSVKVQQGTFSFSTSDTNITETIDAISSTSSAFVVATYTSIQYNNLYYYGFYNVANSYFSANDELTFEVWAAGNVVYGYYYVIEALNNEFSVQHLSYEWPDDYVTYHDRTISQVDLTKSMIVTSSKSHSTFANQALGCYFLNDTTVRLERGYGGPTYEPLGIKIQAIEFNDDAYVEHYSLTWTQSQYTKQQALTNPFSEAYSIIWQPSRMGMPSSSTNYNSDKWQYCSAKYAFINDGEDFQGDRNFGSAAVWAVHRIQVIQWPISTGASEEIYLSNVSMRGLDT